MNRQLSELLWQIKKVVILCFFVSCSYVSFKPRDHFTMSVSVDNQGDKTVEFTLSMQAGSAEDECENDGAFAVFSLAPGTTRKLEVASYCRYEPNSYALSYRFDSEQEVNILSYKKDMIIECQLKCIEI